MAHARAMECSELSTATESRISDLQLSPIIEWPPRTPEPAQPPPQPHAPALEQSTTAFDFDDDDAFDLDERAVHHIELQEKYAHVRKLLEYMKSVRDDGQLFTVDVCEAEEFEALNDAPFANRLQRLNPFPVFDVVQFFDVDPNNPEHTHYYLVPNPARNGELEEARGSATGFIHSFFEHFDDQQKSRNIALQLLTGTRVREDEYTAIRMPAFELPLFEELSLRHERLLEILRYKDALEAKDARIWRRAAPFDEYDFVCFLELQEKILFMWEWGSRSGTALHRSIELFLDDPRTAPTHNPVYHTLEFEYFLNFFRDVFLKGDKRIVRSELRVADWLDDRTGTFAAQRAADKSARIAPALRELLCATYCAGSVDLIYRDVHAPENELMIADWKRSKKIWERAFDNKFGTGPCAHLPDCNLYHYYLQLNLYAYLVEACTHYKVTRLTIIVFHPNNTNYMCYEVPDMRLVIHKLLVERIKHNYLHVYTDEHNAEEARKVAHMEHFLRTKKVDPTHTLEALGIDAYQLKLRAKDAQKDERAQEQHAGDTRKRTRDDSETTIECITID